MNKLVEIWITHGFGSVGSVAKWMAKNYLIANKRFPEKTNKELLLRLIEIRYPSGKAIVGPEYLPESKEEIVRKCHESLEEVTMYILHVEHKELSEIIIEQPNLWKGVVGVVRERLNKFAPGIK